jgi:hypothetical protein
MQFHEEQIVVACPMTQLEGDLINLGSAPNQTRLNLTNFILTAAASEYAAADASESQLTPGMPS